MFKVGQQVTVFDRYRFTIPMQAFITKLSAVNDDVEVELLQSSSPKHPIGDRVWVHEQQLLAQADPAAHPEPTPERERRANDRQVGGEHYMKHGEFQPWDAWWLWNLNAFQGAIIKYVVRYRDKNGLQDLEKARHYLEKLIECEKEKARDAKPATGSGGGAGHS